MQKDAKSKTKLILIEFGFSFGRDCFTNKYIGDSKFLTKKFSLVIAAIQRSQAGISCVLLQQLLSIYTKQQLFLIIPKMFHYTLEYTLKMEEMIEETDKRNFRVKSEVYFFIKLVPIFFFN